MENINQKEVITKSALSMFTGSETFYRHSLARNVIFTEGCAYLCGNGAAWLIDEIALVQSYYQKLCTRTRSGSRVSGYR